MKSQTFLISNEAAMLEFASKLSAAAQSAEEKGCILFLNGNLGAGKTTLVRGFIQSMGHQGAVKSPTYTLVEPYQLAGMEINHFDFYRLKTERECEEMGIRDYLSTNSYCLIEWPEKAKGFLPEPDLVIQIEAIDTNERQLTLKAYSPRAQVWLEKVQAAYA